jgi:hypothetical protein
MRFELEGDNQAMLKALEAYKKEMEDEFVKQRAAGESKLKFMGMGSAINALPEQFDIFYWEENGKVLITIPIFTPRIIKVMGKHKKMADNFKHFFQEQGILVKECRYIGD